MAQGRAEKMARLKQEIGSGTYRPDIRAVAEKMLCRNAWELFGIHPEIDNRPGTRTEDADLK